MWYDTNEANDSGLVDAQLTLSIISAFIITSVFFSVQSIATNTIFLCFIEDSERNDGSAERPYFMSNKLKQLLQK